jgi:hypothetical protein
MSSPPVPPLALPLEGRPFSLYPAIVGIEHNEWRYRGETWAELGLFNTKNGLEIWIPRRYVGAVSRVDEPVMILGLSKELEYRGGQVLPHVRRLLEMPREILEQPAGSREANEPAQVVGIRLEPSERRIGKFIVFALAGVLGTCMLLLLLFAPGRETQVSYRGVLQSELGLTAQDDYHAVVRKLGQPAADQWRSDAGERQYRVLRYPDKGLAIILMGADRESAFYIGAMDRDWKPVDSVVLPGNRNTYAILRTLKPF